MSMYKLIYILTVVVGTIAVAIITVLYRNQQSKRTVALAWYVVSLSFFLLSILVNCSIHHQWNWDFITRLLLFRDIDKGAFYGLHSLGYPSLAAAITETVLTMLKR